MIPVLYKWLMIFSVINFQCVVNFTIPDKAEVRCLWWNHPLYVSVTEIEHNAKDKTLEINCKIYTDDFEKTLRKNYTTAIDLLKPKDKQVMNKLVNDYLQKHLSVSVDGKKIALQFLSYELQDAGVIIYYVVNNITAVNRIDITDTILYDYKKDQIGIIHVTVGGNRKSAKLSNPDDKAGFEF